MSDQPVDAPNASEPPPRVPADITSSKIMPDIATAEINPAVTAHDMAAHFPSANSNAAQTSSEILRTDPLQRRNIGIVLGIMALAGALLFLVVLPLLKRWLKVGELHDVLHRMGILFYYMSAVALAMAVGAALYARRVFRSAAFPPPGSWVWRDTVIKRGQQARTVGWWVVACAAGFALIAMYLAILPAHVGGLTPPPALHAPLPSP